MLNYPGPGDLRGKKGRDRHPGIPPAPGAVDRPAHGAGGGGRGLRPPAVCRT